MSVLSFRKSVDQLDQTAGQLNDLRQLLSHCIRTTAEYAVELKRSDIRALRGNLEQLAAEAEQFSDIANAARLQASFRGELRAYRDQAHAEVERLQSEIASVVESMQTFMTGVSGATGDLKTTLSREFATLESAAESGDIGTIREAIHQAAETALRSCEDARRAQELMTAQLEDEIRNLHKAVDHERRAALTDSLTKVWNRAKLDSRVKDLILLNEGFCLFFVGAPSAIQISATDPRIAPEALKALAGRLQSMAGKDGELGMTGRWSEDVFAIVFNLPLSGAPISPAAMQESLGGPYSIQVDGSCLDIAIQVRVSAVERPKDASESAFYLRLGQTAFQVTSH